jgi:hypothetical protein
VQLRERTFGELFSLIFSLALSHFPMLFVILAVFSLPSLAFNLVYGFGDGLGGPDLESVDLTMAGISLLGLLLIIVANALAQGAGMLLVAGSFTGRSATIGECFGAAFRRLLPLVGFSLLFSLVVGIGLLACLVPGLIFWPMFILGVPAIMVERMRATSAMARSRVLTKGHRWPVLGMQLLITFMLSLINGVVMIAVLLPSMLSEGSEVAAAYTVILWFVQVATMTVTVVFPVVYYFNLRVVKEGFDVLQLTAMVDEIGRRGRAR